MNRRTSRFLFAAGILLLSIAALLGRQQVQPPQRLAALPHAVPAAPQQRLGVSADLRALSAAERAAAFSAMQAARIGWVRQPFPWDEIEAVRGEFNWQPWDEVVAAAAAQQIELVAVLDRSPVWARAAEDEHNPAAPPADNADFGRFAAALAARYGASLHFYQIWDEPNIAPHWGQRWADAAAYGALLREAAIQLRAADADAVVLTAALAPTTEPGGVNQSDIAFLDALYRAGAAAWFDAVAAQPYGFDRPADDPPSPDVLNFRRIELLRAVMQHHGDEATPIWASGFGWHTAANAAPGWAAVTPAQQADAVVWALQWAEQQPDWLAALGWPAWQPRSTAGPRTAFALVAADGHATPALAMLSGWTGKPAAVGEGLWPPTAALTSGGWRLTAEAGDAPRTALSDPLHLYFSGSTLALDLQRGPYRGNLFLRIDDQPANALPHTGGDAAYLPLYDPLAGSDTVVVARDLQPGWHSVEIRADGGWGQWPLRGFRVLAAPSPQWPGWVVWVAGLAGALALAVGLSGLARQHHEAGPLLPAVAAGSGAQAAACVLAATGVAALWLAPAPWPAAVFALLALLFLAFPAVALFAVGLAVPFFLHPISVLGRAWNPAELLIWLAATMAGLRWGITAWRSRSSSPVFWVWHPLDGPVLALLIAAALSLVAAQRVGVALHELRTVLLAGVLVYGLVRRAAADAAGRFDPWPLVWGLSLSAAAAAIWGMVQAATGQGVITAEGVWRVRGPYASPNNLALLLDHIWPLLLAVVMFERLRARRVMAGLLAAVVFAGALLTVSKGALLIGLPLALLVLGWLAGGRWRWAVLAVLVLGAAALLPLWRTERFADLFNLSSGTGLIRTQLWRGTWEMIRDRAWSGVGLDNFLYAYRTRYALPAAWQELNLSHPHNVVLDLWTRLGFAGLLAGLWLFAVAIRYAWSALRQADGASKALPAGVLVSLLVTLAHGMIDNSIFLMDLMVVMMASVALVARGAITRHT